jgi:hypothetical protein
MKRRDLLKGLAAAAPAVILAKAFGTEPKPEPAVSEPEARENTAESQLLETQLASTLAVEKRFIQESLCRAAEQADAFSPTMVATVLINDTVIDADGNVVVMLDGVARTPQEAVERLQKNSVYANLYGQRAKDVPRRYLGVETGRFYGGNGPNESS